MGKEHTSEVEELPIAGKGPGHVLKRQRELEFENQELRRLNMLLEERIIERTAQLQRLAFELTQTEDRERRRLAQLLHDHLQQTLFGAKLHLEFLMQQNQGLAFRQQAGQIEKLLTDSIELTRSLSQELSPPVLREVGLTAGLKWLARWMQENHALTVQVEVEEDPEPEDQTVRALLFQCVRELLFNVVKHAGVAAAHVQMKEIGQSQIQILVIDHGSGCNPARLQSSSSSGFGLSSIRERLDLFGGRLEIQSSSGNGSRFTLVCPKQVQPLHKNR